ncbi:protease inhibitor I42 family protein [Methanoregula formicica]|uniref:protease inhibitor I42 family protein n=1 Tax=Methanoregula formicica TaxID=882104 RepID=UPI0011D1AB60|nr:protease inhibitor I42 family protein [Methanoregula formicica]
MPGIRYSLGENDSGKTIILGKGDIVEINLRWIPGLGFHWVIPVSGCGLELVNAGTFSDGGDFWNNTGHYRVRYRAVSPGTSIIDGKFILSHEGKGDLGFNLTVIVK